MFQSVVKILQKYDILKFWYFLTIFWSYYFSKYILELVFCLNFEPYFYNHRQKRQIRRPINSVQFVQILPRFSNFGQKFKKLFIFQFIRFLSVKIAEWKLIIFLLVIACSDRMKSSWSESAFFVE